MLSLAPVFKDHAVLQREKYVPVWGSAASGAAVTLELDGALVRTVADTEGRWCAALPPHGAGGPYELEIACCGETLCRSDIVYGDVWLAGGQSNMELPLVESRNGKREAASANHPGIRFYNVPKRAVVDEALTEMEAASAWRACSPETAGEMSAVAYYFARQIHGAQNVPVGVIGCYWGGSSISCWMGEGQLKRSVAGQRYLDDYAALVGEKTDAQYQWEMEEYNALHAQWQERVDALRQENPRICWEEIHRLCGECPLPQPAGNTSPYRPANLYRSMLRRICPYGLKGFLWYQGEEDVARCHDYGEMLAFLIDQWRCDWNDPFLPFLLCQFPMYTAAADYAAHRDDTHWAVLRDQQLAVSRFVANTAIAVLADCGEFDNVHPADKQTVGTRLALLARKKYYGENVSAHEPTFEYAHADGSTMIVGFRSTGGHLAVQGDALEGFALAGADGVFYRAAGRTELDRVYLSAPEVSAPVYVRYAWTNYGPANLYGASGLPAAPFRTDDFPIP